MGDSLDRPRGVVSIRCDRGCRTDGDAAGLGDSYVYASAYGDGDTNHRSDGHSNHCRDALAYLYSSA
jgi:hypothetical protein